MNDEITSEIKIACPHCGQHLVIDTSMFGTELECPTCKQPFSVSAPTTGNETESEESASPVGIADGTPEPACEETAEADMTPPTATSAPPPLPPPLPPSTPEPAPAMSRAFRDVARDFANRAHGSLKKGLKISISAAQAMSRASRDVAHDFAKQAHGLRNRGKIIALLAVVPLLACTFFLFGRGCFQEDIIPDGTLKVAISDSEIQSANEGTRDSPFIQYEFPWENQACCLSFDIRFGRSVGNETNGKSKQVWLLTLQTLDHADSLILNFVDGQIKFKTGQTDDYTDGPNISVKEDGSLGRWHSITILAGKNETVFSMDGNQYSLPAVGGVKRFSNLFVMGSGTLSEIRNMAVYPSKAYRESLKVYREALDLVRKDPKSSMAKLHQAAESGLCEAQRSLGVFLKGGVLGKQDEKAALRWIRKAAEQGDPTCQWILGKALLWGKDIPEDRKAAHDWLLRGAKSGNAGAQMWLGFQLWRGLGVPKNPSEAKRWLIRAENGYSHDNECLNDVDAGILYFTLAEISIIGGEGIEKDRERAILYLRISAQHGNSDARDLLRKVR